eukprot:SAG11_NODE_2070_length_3864_cov_1.772112_1_plen_134_part_00
MSGRVRRERKTSSKLAWLKEQDEQWAESQKRSAAITKKKRKLKKAEAKKVVVIHKAAPKVKMPKLKKASTAYVLFSKAIQPRIMEDYPEATVGERSKIASELWSELGETRKARWTALATKDKLRADREKAALE